MKILRIWGISIDRILSDTEFVEKIRKGLRHSRKFVWIHVSVLLVVCVIVPATVGLVWQLTQDNPDETRKWIYAGLLFGFLFGAFAGQYLVTGVQAVLMALDLFDYNRASRLLIKYHDMLQQMDALDENDEQNR
jgi:hypothetical protein